MVAKCVPIDGVQTVIRQECSQIRQEFFAAAVKVQDGWSQNLPITAVKVQDGWPQNLPIIRNGNHRFPQG